MRRFTRRAIDLRRVEVVVRGRPVTYQVGGAGDPVVLVHGLAGSARWWRRNVAALAHRHTVYLVNLPGFGSFGRPGRRFALSDGAGWLAAWIEEVGIGPCHVVAHSMGGYLAISLAAGRPDLVRRLVLVAPAVIAGHRPLRAYPLAMVAAGFAIRPNFLPLLALDSLRAGPLTILRSARRLLAEDVREQLGAVVAPTLLVWGSRDALVPPSLGPRVRAALHDAALLVLPGAGHVPNYDRPREFNAAVLAFLAGRTGGTEAGSSLRRGTARSPRPGGTAGCS
jgi:pimeloyl-ACP methyl ester carboxylesterase